MSDQNADANERIRWRRHWIKAGFPWRTEPEISSSRQTLLLEQQRSMSDDADDQSLLPTPVPVIEILGDRVKISTFTETRRSRERPFERMNLTRADVEWLLAIHQQGAGPVDWSIVEQRERIGLDLRGTFLRDSNGPVDLSKLPLARTRFKDAHLESAKLNGSHLEGAELERAHLEGANLVDAHLERIDAMQVHCEGANLSDAYLEDAFLALASMDYADLRNAHFDRANLRSASLSGANLMKAHLEGTDCTDAYFAGKDALRLAELREWKSDFPDTLEAANLSSAFFDAATNLSGATLRSGESSVRIVDAHWGGANLGVVLWSEQFPANGPLLGDEMVLASPMHGAGNGRLRDAVRANRQLAVALREQGLNEEADHFAYRAQICQRRVFLRQHKYGAYGLSLGIDLLAGYGYRPLRSLIAYVLIVTCFAGLFLVSSHFTSPSLSWDEALVLSVSSFHGRGFFSQNVTLGDVFARVAAVEAFVGLIIEVSFIATFSQRFLGK